MGILRLCHVETQAVAAGMSFCLSPQVASTAMWSLRRWTAAYLLPNESYYSQVRTELEATEAERFPTQRTIPVQNWRPLRIGHNLSCPSRLYYGMTPMKKSLPKEGKSEKTKMMVIFVPLHLCVCQQLRVRQQPSFSCGCAAASRLLHLKEAGQR